MRLYSPTNTISAVTAKDVLWINGDGITFPKSSDIYKGVKAMKPWVKVGYLPCRNRDTPPLFFPWLECVLYRLSRPARMARRRYSGSDISMMYFQGNSFYPFALDWQEQSNGRQVIPARYLFPSRRRREVDTMKWIVRLISSVIRNGRRRTLPCQVSDGQYSGIYDELIENFYAYPALQPPDDMVG